MFTPKLKAEEKEKEAKKSKKMIRSGVEKRKMFVKYLLQVFLFDWVKQRT